MKQYKVKHNNVVKLIEYLKNSKVKKDKKVNNYGYIIK